MTGLRKLKLQSGGSLRREEEVTDSTISGMSALTLPAPRLTFIPQMYIDEKRNVSSEILQKVEHLGASAIVFTIDVGWGSKRTLENYTGGSLPKSQLGAFMASGGLQDRNLSWNDISWMRVSFG